MEANRIQKWTHGVSWFLPRKQLYDGTGILFFKVVLLQMDMQEQMSPEKPWDLKHNDKIPWKLQWRFSVCHWRDLLRTNNCIEHCLPSNVSIPCPKTRFRWTHEFSNIREYHTLHGCTNAWTVSCNIKWWDRLYYLMLNFWNHHKYIHMLYVY